MNSRPAIAHFFVALWLVFNAAITVADNTSPNISETALPAIALIIDDLGNQYKQGERVVQLPGPVACSFLPYGPFTRELANQAHMQNKEVLLHLPMQAAAYEQALDEEGVLTLNMTHQQFLTTLQDDLDAVPFVSGVNNHMGSLLTRHPGHMAWLMQSISEQGSLFFVDSRTTDETVAARLAREYGVPNTERNVFLDNEPDPEAIRAEFRRLLDIARRQGFALGIAHPHTETLQVLREEINKLESQGVALITVARLIELQNRRDESWHAFLSR
jgi:polysaccharide deacetylase 2 family uncharacterized protein YibQ